MIGDLAGLKVYLGITGSDQDAFLTLLLSSANSILTKLLQTNIEEETYVKTFLGECTNVIFLDTTPISFPTYGTNSWIKIDDELIAEDDFVFEATTGKVILKTRTPSRIETVEIQYVGGYDPVPDEVLIAIYEICKVMYDARTRSGIGSESMGDISVDYEDTTESAKFASNPAVLAVKSIYGHLNS